MSLASDDRRQRGNPRGLNGARFSNATEGFEEGPLEVQPPRGAAMVALFGGLCGLLGTSNGTCNRLFFFFPELGLVLGGVWWGLRFVVHINSAT